MPRKDRDWQKIKAMKPPEEWRRIYRAYGQRRRLKNQLRLKGADLLKQIQNYRLIENPGPADMLIDEVEKALRLPYGWRQEAYDHSVARLNEIAGDIRKIQLRITPKKSKLANMLMMAILNAGDTDDVKATAVVGVMEHMAKQLSTEQVMELEQSKTNYLMTLLRTYDNYYPAWFPRFLFENIILLLREEDIKVMAGWLADEVVTYNSRDNILDLISMDEERDEAEIR